MGSQSEADSESNISSFRDSLLNGGGDYSPLRSSENSPLRFVSDLLNCSSASKLAKNKQTNKKPANKHKNKQNKKKKVRSIYAKTKLHRKTSQQRI